MIRLELHADEESSYFVTVSYYNEDGDSITPLTAYWTLTDKDGNVMNEREDVEITSLSTSNIIVMYGDDLSVGDEGNERKLLIKGTYHNDDLDMDLPFTGQATFYIDDFASI